MITKVKMTAQKQEVSNASSVEPYTFKPEPTTLTQAPNWTISINSNDNIYNVKYNGKYEIAYPPSVSDMAYEEPIFEGTIEEIDVPDETAEKMILELISKKAGLDYSDIAVELKLDIDTVFRLCDKLVREKKIATG